MRAAERGDITGTDQDDAPRHGSLAAPSTRPPAPEAPAAPPAPVTAGTPEVVVTSPATARLYVRSMLHAYGDAAFAGVRQEAVLDLLLVVSELVTNAIRHGGGLAGFGATVTGEGVRLDVRDNSDVVPAGAYGSATIPEGYRPGGYGWPLIIRLSREITVEPSPGGGKTIRVLVPMT